MKNEAMDFSVVRRHSKVSPEWRLTEALGQPYKDYRKLWESVLTGEVTPNFPINLDMELQDWCNQACVICPRNSQHHPDIPFRINTHTTPDLETLESVVREAGKLGSLSINFGAFSEPLVSRHLWSLVNLAHASGFVDSRIITNGLLLEQHLDNIFASELRNVFVSIDAATEGTYEGIRGKGFAKVQGNVRRLVDERERRGTLLPVIRVSFVEMDSNAHEVSEFVAYWAEIVDHVDVQARTDYAEEIRLDGLSGEEEPKSWECKSPWQRLAVTADGEVLPCCDFNGKNIPLAHIEEASLEEVWNGPRIDFLREGLERDSVPNCNACQRSKIGERLDWQSVGL